MDQHPGDGGRGSRAANFVCIFILVDNNCNDKDVYYVIVHVGHLHVQGLLSSCVCVPFLPVLLWGGSADLVCWPKHTRTPTLEPAEEFVISLSFSFWLHLWLEAFISHQPIKDSSRGLSQLFVLTTGDPERKVKLFFWNDETLVF